MFDPKLQFQLILLLEIPENAENFTVSPSQWFIEKILADGISSCTIISIVSLTLHKVLKCSTIYVVVTVNYTWWWYIFIYIYIQRERNFFKINSSLTFTYNKYLDWTDLVDTNEWKVKWILMFLLSLSISVVLM